MPADRMPARFLTLRGIRVCLARQGRLRNASPPLFGMVLAPGDLTALTAFLKSLNEDYE